MINAQAHPDCRICGHVPSCDSKAEWEDMTRCSQCGCVQASQIPTLTELRSFYGTAYLDNYTAGMPEKRFRREMPLRHAAKLALVRKMAGVGKLVDVGCGEGDFVEQAIQAGFDACGCDYGLRSNYPRGVTVKEGCLDEKHGLPFDDEEYDIVTSWAVIEHVYAPHQAIAEIRRILRTGGFLFCDTPLCNDMCERLVAARSHWLCPPEHLHVFSALGLRLLLEKSGFEIVKHSPFYERSLVRWLARRGRNVAVGAMMGGIKKLLTPLAWGESRVRQVTSIGDIQLVVARKL